VVIVHSIRGRDRVRLEIRAHEKQGIYRTELLERLERVARVPRIPRD